MLKIQQTSAIKINKIKTIPLSRFLFARDRLCSVFFYSYCPPGKRPPLELPQNSMVLIQKLNCESTAQQAGHLCSVASTSMQCHDVAWMLMRCCLDVMCLLGELIILLTAVKREISAVLTTRPPMGSFLKNSVGPYFCQIQSWLLIRTGSIK